MKSNFLPQLSLLCLSMFSFCATGSAASHETNEAPHGRIRNREQLLTAVNAWMKENHQRPWSMSELIGYTFDQANIVFAHYYDSPFNPPLESFLISLAENKPFTHDVKLRTDRREGYEVSTANEAYIRRRLEWQKVVKKEMRLTEVKSSKTNIRRLLPIPPHLALSLDVIATPAEIQNEKANPAKLRHWELFLTSALLEKQSPKIPTDINGPITGFVAGPGELLESLNVWKHALHQPEATLDEITARVADEMFSLQEANALDLWREDLELFLECLVKDAPFVYPMRIETEGPAEPSKPDTQKMVSINKVITLPPRYSISIQVLDLPWGASDGDTTLKIDWQSIILSHAFPRHDGTTTPKQAQ